LDLWGKLKLLSLTHTTKKSTDEDQPEQVKSRSILRKLFLTREKNNEDIRPLRTITYKELGGLMVDMHDWYFDKGIFLSSSNRVKYFNLKNAIIEGLEDVKIDLLQLVEKKAGFEERDDVKEKLAMILKPDKQKNILTMATEFRKSLANDIGARRENRLTSRRETDL
jgi:hypothetical protein